MHGADVVQRGRLAGPVPDLPLDRQGLPEVLQRPLPLAQGVMHGADVGQRGRLAAAVAGGPVQAQCLIVGGQRRGRVPGGVSGPPELIQGAGVLAQGQGQLGQPGHIREP